jgi:hypothetical protein
MSVTGLAVRSGANVRVGDKWNDREPVELGEGAALRLMHTVSTRQWTLAGPARLVACADGGEELVLARGTLRTEPAAGVRPGAEVWVGTPFGSVRYADARAEVAVGATALDVRVSLGTLWFAPLGDQASARGESPKERPLTEAMLSFAARSYRASPERAIARCGEAATLARARAQTLLAASAEPLGTRAAEHVRARQRARSACSSAFAALLAEDTDPAADGHHQARFAELGRYDVMWRGVPDPPLAAQRP